MSEGNLEKWINIKFYVKIGKSASETLALLKMACSEHAMNNLSILHGSCS